MTNTKKGALSIVDGDDGKANTDLADYHFSSASWLVERSLTTEFPYRYRGKRESQTSHPVS